MTPEKALLIATVAHGAKGQMRWAGVPYIVHPKRVALLVRWFMRKYNLAILTEHWLKSTPSTYYKLLTRDLVVAAYLHDVLEDTELPVDTLIDEGITPVQMSYVLDMTKPDDGPAPASYYEQISKSVGSMVVKCADRCSNLEDAYKELFAPVEDREVKRWANYITASYRDVLPMYDRLPGLQGEIQWRLDRIEKVIPLARAQREAHVSRKRLESAAKFHKVSVEAMESLCLDCGKPFDQPGVPAICAADHKEAA